MAEPHPPPRSVHPRPAPASPLAPTGGPLGGFRPFPEPPTPASHRPDVPPACVSCAAPVTLRSSPPLCWGCGRTLCVDCYWRHGLHHAVHLCTTCAGRGVSATARSGGHRVAGLPP